MQGAPFQLSVWTARIDALLGFLAHAFAHFFAQVLNIVPCSDHLNAHARASFAILLERPDLLHFALLLMFFYAAGRVFILVIFSAGRAPGEDGLS